MITTARRRGATAALLLIVPLLGACGFNAQTEQVYQAATGTNERNVDGVDVLNALIVSAHDGEGTFAGSLALPDDADPVQLTSMTDADLSSPITVQPGSVLNLALSGRVQMHGPDIVAGRIIPITFSFSSGQTVQMLVPVVDHNGEFSNVPVGRPSPTGRPMISATPSPGAAASATATPSGPESALPSSSPSPSASPSAG